MTDKEIVQALRCCKFGEPCYRCPVVSDQNCVNVMHKRAADLRAVRMRREIHGACVFGRQRAFLVR